MYVMQNYDDALRCILEHGEVKKNRTGVDCRTIFGIQSRYQINECFPLLTGRRIWPKSIFAELLWFLSGSTNNKDLQALGSNIWTPWVNKDFEEKHGYADGAFGPVYGFQLRHFNGFYGNGIGGKNAKDTLIWDQAEETPPPYEERKNTTGYKFYANRPPVSLYGGHEGFDQLKYVMDLLKTDPSSRRILFSLWNPKQLEDMRLPPCHYTFQLYVHDDKLSGMLTQRSCDFPVGVPANVQFYSALIYMLAQQCGFVPYEFVHSTVDSHIYVDQISAVEEYLGRDKPNSPKLVLRKAASITEYGVDDFKVVDYNPLPTIKIPVAV